MWAAGVSQGLLWLSVDQLGELSFGFRDIMASMTPYYLLRLVAGLIFLTGTFLMTYNLFMTLKGQHATKVTVPAVNPAYGV
jgi:cytochrome c oxidase cbb3-type subunit 1